MTAPLKPQAEGTTKLNLNQSVSEMMPSYYVAQLQAVLDSIDFFVVLLDPEYKILAFNQQAAVEQCNKKLEKLQVGQSGLELVSATHLEKFKQNFQAALSGQTLKVERTTQTATNDPKWWEFSYKLIRMENGNIIGVSLTLEDITRRELAEERLQHSFATNRALLNALPDLMFRISGEGTFLNWKAGREVNLGFIPGEFIGKRVDEMWPVEVAIQAHHCIEQALRTGETQQMEFSLTHNDNTEPHWYEARYAVSSEHEVIAIIRDISENKTRLNALKMRAIQQSTVAGLSQSALLGTEPGALMDSMVNLTAITLNIDFSAILEYLPDQSGFIYRAGSNWIWDKAELIGQIRPLEDAIPRRDFTYHSSQSTDIETFYAAIAGPRNGTERTKVALYFYDFARVSYSAQYNPGLGGIARNLQP